MGRWFALIALAALLVGAVLLRGGGVDSPTPLDLAHQTPEPAASLDAPSPAEQRRMAPLAMPTDAREDVSLESPTLVGRLVLADGGVYANETPQLSVTRSTGAQLRSQPVETNGEGRFTFPVTNVEKPFEGLRLTIRERGRIPRPLTATLELPRLERGASTDLGDVVLLRHTLGVTCRVVDRVGNSVVPEAAGLGPEVELWGPDGLERHDDAWERGSGVVLQFDDGEVTGWLALDARGSSIFPKPWLVDPTQPGARPRAVGGRTGLAVRIGDDVELVVAHGGTIRGSVVQDEGLSARVDQVRARAMEDVEPLTWGRDEDEQVVYAAIAEDGRFEIEGVDAGLRRIEFLWGHLAFFTVENIEVRLEEVVEDPRLQAVDLGVLTHTILLRVVDTGEALVPDAAATLALAGSYGEFSRAGDEIHVLLPDGTGIGASGADLVVHAPGFVPARLTPPFRDTTVVLEPAIPIRTRTAAPFENDIGSHGFWLRLRRVDGPEAAGWLWATELPFGWDGTEPAEITAPGPGRYELEVMVKVRMGTLFGTSPSDRYVGTGVFLDVGPEHAASPLVVDVPEDLLRFDT